MPQANSQLFDDDDPILTSMDLPSSPISSPNPKGSQKRPHSEVEPDAGDELVNIFSTEGPSASLPPAVVNKNTLVAIKSYAAKKKLKTDQIADLEQFTRDPPLVREAKIMACLIQTNNRLNELHAAAPQFFINDSLKKNILALGNRVLLSTKLITYKGEALKAQLLTVILRQGYDLPPNIESNHANYRVLERAAGMALTNKRSSMKKLIRKSLTGSEDADEAIKPDSSEHMSIYDLTKAFVKGTKCKTTPALCARVALMREVFMKDQGEAFWDNVDNRIAKIREKATQAGLENAATRIVKAYAKILKNDRELHGSQVAEQEFPEEVGQVQQDIDSVIESHVLNASTSTAVAPGNSNDNDNENN